MKINTKGWRIGTHIDSYIRKFDALINGNNINKFTVKLASKDKYNIIFEGNIIGEEFGAVTLRQMLSTYITLGLINADKDYLNVGDFFKATYTVEKNRGETSNINYSYETFWKKAFKIFTGEYKSKFRNDDSLAFSILSTAASLEDKSVAKIIDVLLESEKIDEYSKWFKKQVVAMMSYKASKDSYKAQIDTLVNDVNKDYLMANYDEVEPVIDDSFKLRENINLENKLALQSTPFTLGEYFFKTHNETTRLNIPIFQREYRWNQDLLENYLNDIMNIDKGGYHYIGNILIKSEDNGRVVKREIIDGQQRLTTNILILAAIYRIALVNKWPIPKELSNFLNFNESEPNVVRIFERIKGNPDFDTFKEIMCNDTEMFCNKSNVMVSNFKFTLDYLTPHINSSGELKRFLDNILNGICFVQIINSVSDKHVLFEKLNTGSEPLNNIELIKSFLHEQYFATIKDFSDEIFQSEFTVKILRHFKDKKDKINNKEIDDYINAELRLNNHYKIKTSVFKAYQNHISKQADELKDKTGILTEISKSVNWFKNLTDYDLYKSDSSPLYRISDFLTILNNRVVYTPLIWKIIKLHLGEDINSMSKDENIVIVNKVRKLLSAIEKFEVKLQVAKYRGQSLSEKIIWTLSMVDSKTTYEDLYKLLDSNKSESGEIATDTEFRDALKGKKINNKPAVLITYRIENYLGKDFAISKDHKFNCMHTKMATREHLLPTKFKNWLPDLKKWTDHDDIVGEIDLVINKIGNAFPIPGWKNATLKNAKLSNKLAMENMGTVNINELSLFKGIEDGEILEGVSIEKITDKFTPEIINKRTDAIAELAVEIWKK